MFLAEGVAGSEGRYRTGARHAFIAFVASSDLQSAQQRAKRYSAEKGWTFVVVKRGVELAADTSLIEDDILRSAAMDAQSNGAAIVVYADEIPANA